MDEAAAAAVANSKLEKWVVAAAAAASASEEFEDWISVVAVEDETEGRDFPEVRGLRNLGFEVPPMASDVGWRFISFAYFYDRGYQIDNSIWIIFSFEKSMYSRRD